ncbi:SDR family oxidoreductase [Microbacterium sp. ASV81]|uniref:NAD(P)H-binding protein n=1 Tax=Microbacterium capsulatum TaxID=3041921 RepID=A0ABU0XJB3_9MICO|nr:NAD(P)H-binding protein [Microbacterium sp. ASV81]MDQ4215234.1 NAD(P)H-binding protein [Microbacterium sp. ASV81]
MTTTILVTGGTGGLGSHVVPLLAAHDVDIRILTRHPRPDEGRVTYAAGDTVEGTGLAAAMAGADVVLHLAGGPKGDDVGTAHVVDAARAAGVGHVVMISVIGAEGMPIGYFRRKAEAERILAAGGVPWTVLRAAQFHSFAYGMVRPMAKLPIVPVMKDVRLEPVAVQDVAARLVELALGAPQGRVADLAGPEVRSLESLIDALPGRSRPHLRFGLPGAVGRAYRSEANLAGGTVQRGTGTWSEFLADQAA